MCLTQCGLFGFMQLTLAHGPDHFKRLQSPSSTFKYDVAHLNTPNSNTHRFHHEYHLTFHTSIAIGQSIGSLVGYFLQFLQLGRVG